MSFLNPWLLLGLLGIAVPTIIHLVSKRRAMVVNSRRSTCFKPSPNVWHAGSGFGSVLLLLLRTLAIAALVFALARPVESSELVTETGLKMSLLWSM